MLHAAIEVRTISQARHADLAQVHCWCHSNIEGALGDVISTVGHSKSKRTLETRNRTRFG